MAARNEARSGGRVASGREAFEGFDFEGQSFVCGAAASSAMLFQALSLKEAFLSLGSPSRRGTPSLKTTSRRLSDRETRLPRERLRPPPPASPLGLGGGGAQRGVSESVGPFVCSAGGETPEWRMCAFQERVRKGRATPRSHDCRETAKLQFTVWINSDITFPSGFFYFLLSLMCTQTGYCS